MTQIPTVDLGGGVTLPIVGFGTWQLGGRRAYEAVTSRSPPIPPGLT